MKDLRGALSLASFADKQAGIGEILIQSRTLGGTCKNEEPLIPSDDVQRLSLQPQKHRRNDLNLFDKCGADDLSAIELKFNFAAKHVKQEKSLDYKTGAIWHRITNRDTDPRAKILLQR